MVKRLPDSDDAPDFEALVAAVRRTASAEDEALLDALCGHLLCIMDAIVTVGLNLPESVRMLKKALSAPPPPRKPQVRRRRRSRSCVVLHLTPELEVGGSNLVSRKARLSWALGCR